MFTLNLDVVVDAVGVDHAGDCNGRIGPGVKRKGARNSLTSLVLHAAVAHLRPDAYGVPVEERCVADQANGGREMVYLEGALHIAPYHTCSS